MQACAHLANPVLAAPESHRSRWEKSLTQAPTLRACETELLAPEGWRLCPSTRALVLHAVKFKLSLSSDCPGHLRHLPWEGHQPRLPDRAASAYKIPS